MIVCPNCNHPNPDGAVQCEACYTPLPTTSNCPNCGATVQADAAFCGQCGYNLHSNLAPAAATSVATVAPDIPVEVPQLVEPDPLLELLQPDPLGINPDPNANQPA
ncbi:MAG: zinc ribbon domain-containing protein, partial [Nodularia sp. (in: cyanobacteria)]|nr:zinc ribbon domain-containing protein [Nodularia sp. (in: cyanobacteria)]